MKGMAGKVVVLTGAGSGIGKALTEQLLSLGASVWALDQNREALMFLSENAKKFGHALQILKADVGNTDDMHSAMKEIVAKTPAIHYWINNAGVAGLGDFIARPIEDFEATLRVNLMGVAIGSYLAIQHMEKLGQGTVVNVASVAGHISAPYLVAYSASKHGVVGFTRALRQELKLKDSPIKLVLVSPGFVDTQMIARGTRAGFPEWLSSVLSKPEDVAKEMIQGLIRQREEIFPTLNGKFLIRLNKVLPALTARSSTLLLTKSFKDFLLMRKTPPG